MKTQTLATPDGASIATFTWRPAGSPRAVVQIVHGMAEHAARYDELTQALNAAGHAVCAHDHRGHGRSVASPEKLGTFEETDIWRAWLDDIALVRRRIGAEFPGLPVFLLGHSMGSFLAQQAAAENGQLYAGLVLSGTYREPRLRARAGALVARLERKRLGRHGRSRLIRALTFDAYARRFAPTRTAFDWLSRHAPEVDKYIADPRCGFEPSVQLWIALLHALAVGLPLPAPALPVCLLIGQHDPVTAADPGATRLADDLRRAGHHRIAQCVYPEARHELFHETNRAEVFADLISWLDQFAPEADEKESRLSDLN